MICQLFHFNYLKKHRFFVYMFCCMAPARFNEDACLPAASFLEAGSPGASMGEVFGCLPKIFEAGNEVQPPHVIGNEAGNEGNPIGFTQADAAHDIAAWLQTLPYDSFEPPCVTVPERARFVIRALC